jgi:hypothetical protein
MRTALVYRVSIALALLWLALFAEHAYQVNDARSNSAAYGGDSVGSHSPRMGDKTRAEVYTELIQVKAGILPLNRNDYPPSQQSIRRNRDLNPATL